MLIEEEEDHENLAKLAALKVAIDEGMEGEAEDIEIVFARLRQRIRDRAATQRNSGGSDAD